MQTPLPGIHRSLGFQAFGDTVCPGGPAKIKKEIKDIRTPKLSYPHHPPHHPPHQPPHQPPHHPHVPTPAEGGPGSGGGAKLPAGADIGVIGGGPPLPG